MFNKKDLDIEKLSSDTMSNTSKSKLEKDLNQLCEDNHIQYEIEYVFRFHHTNVIFTKGNRHIKLSLEDAWLENVKHFSYPYEIMEYIKTQISEFITPPK